MGILSDVIKWKQGERQKDQLVEQRFKDFGNMLLKQNALIKSQAKEKQVFQTKLLADGNMLDDDMNVVRNPESNITQQRQAKTMLEQENAAKAQREGVRATSPGMQGALTKEAIAESKADTAVAGGKSILEGIRSDVASGKEITPGQTKVAKGGGILKTDISNITEEYSDIDSQKLLAVAGGLQSKFKSRGMKSMLPVAVKIMRDNPEMTPDDVLDNMRKSGQSPEFTGGVRGAAQSIFANSSDSVAKRGMDYIDDLQDDPERLRDQLKRSARQQAPTAQRAEIEGKERLSDVLVEVKDSLQSYKDAGGDTNIFKGTKQQIENKIGQIGDPELRKIAVKSQIALFGYVKALSGVAVAEPEFQRISSVFPKIGNTYALNMATIESVTDTIGGDVKKFYTNSMGKKNYKDIFGSQTFEIDGKTYNIPADEVKAFKKDMGV